MILKTKSYQVAEELKALGFLYYTEHNKKETLYCFDTSSELTKIVFDKYACEQFIVDEYAHF